MIRLLALAVATALVTACATDPPAGGSDTLQGKRAATPMGMSKAAQLGFHGPPYRGADAGGPN